MTEAVRYVKTAVTASAVRRGGESMSTSFIVGVCMMGALCITCLTTSIAVLIKAQELHSRSVDILVCAYDWLERIQQENRKENITSHEGTN